MLKSMLFDYITGLSLIKLPCFSNEGKEGKNNEIKVETGEILLPFCLTGVTKCTESQDEFSIANAHWICTSCLAVRFLKTKKPNLSGRGEESEEMVCKDTTQTTTTIEEQEDEQLCEDEEQEEKSRAFKSFCDFENRPSICVNGDFCPICKSTLCPTAVAMFLAICEAQNADYSRMRNCWISECVRNVKMRKLIRDLQYYLLFDESLQDTRLKLDKMPDMYCVRVERRVNAPAHVRSSDTPESEQHGTELHTAIRTRTKPEYQLSDCPPTITTRSLLRKRKQSESTGVPNQIKRDNSLFEPRERLLFEAFNLQNDFDEATMPMNANALTRREQRALRRTLKTL